MKEQYWPLRKCVRCVRRIVRRIARRASRNWIALPDLEILYHLYRILIFVPDIKRKGPNLPRNFRSRLLLYFFGLWSKSRSSLSSISLVYLIVTLEADKNGITNPFWVWHSSSLGFSLALDRYFYSFTKLRLSRSRYWPVIKTRFRVEATSCITCFLLSILPPTIVDCIV